MKTRTLAALAVTAALLAGCGSSDRGEVARITTTTADPDDPAEETTTTVPGAGTSTVVDGNDTNQPPAAEYSDEQILAGAKVVVDDWIQMAWTDAAKDPFGYDYTRWVDALAAPTADVDALRDGPLPIGFDEFNRRVDAGELREMRAADLRSALWILKAEADAGSWQAAELDPEFRIDAISDSSGEAFVGNDVAPEVVRGADGELDHVLYPVMIDLVTHHTEPGGPATSRMRLGTTLSLVANDTRDGLQIASTWAAGDDVFVHLAETADLDGDA